MYKNLYYENLNPSTNQQFKNILIIEDDIDLAELISNQIEKKMNCLIHIAIDPYEAINLMVENYYDLVILDWNLPGLNGIETIIQTEKSLKFETLLSLQWELKKVQVIILSAFNKNQCSSRNTKHFNFIGYVSKQQSLEKIILLLSEYIKNEKNSSYQTA